MKKNILEIICPKCRAYWKLKFINIPISPKVFCPTCDAYLDVLDLYTSGNGRPYYEDLPQIDNLDALIEYNERTNDDSKSDINN